MTEFVRRRRADAELAPKALVERFPGPALLADAAGGVIVHSPKGARLADLLVNGIAVDLALAIVSCSSDLTPRTMRLDVSSEPERLHLELTLMPVDMLGDTQVMVLGRDVTVERKLTEALVASRRLFKDIEAVSSDFGWETDTEGRFTYVSVRGALGFAAHELHGDTARRLAPDPDAPPVPWPFEATIPVDAPEIWLRRKDGTLACCEMASRPVLGDHGELVGVRGVARDVTERFTAQAARAAAEAEAIAANEAKSRFLAIMSHELRTPINSLIGNLELLKTTSLNNDQAELIQSTEIAAESLLRIIGDILDFSKIEAGKIELERLTYEPARLINEVVSLMNPSAVGKGITVEGLVHASVPTSAVIDPYRLRQILINLVGNALKFTEIGGVLVSMRMIDGKLAGPALFVSVDDTGIGFDPGQVDLFQPFTQADGSTTRRFGGSGLGLSICRGLVERMGGEIGVESSPGGGATFWFTVPLDDYIPQTDPAALLKGQRIVLSVTDPASWVGVIAALSGVGVAVSLLDPIGLERDGLANDGDNPWLAIITDIPTIGRRSTHAIGRILVSEADDITTRRRAHKLGFSQVLVNGPSPHDVQLALATLAREDLPTIAAISTIDESAIVDLKTMFKDRFVLVLEDNPMSRAVITRQFQTMGLAVDLAENGRLGLEALDRRDYALVLTDCAMPEIDGYLFTQILRRREMGTGRHMPVIAMTANAADDDAKKCLAAGMDDYLSKPVRLTVLAKVLANWGSGQGRARLEAAARENNAPIDLALLGQILGDESAEAIDEALSLFAEFFPGFLTSAQEAFIERDFEAMADAAHTSKGAARNAGALALGQALGAAEDHARDQDLAAYGLDIEQAQQEWLKVQAFIKARSTGAPPAMVLPAHEQIGLRHD
jgi:PAS domain S-box-containing protein